MVNPNLISYPALILIIYLSTTDILTFELNLDSTFFPYIILIYSLYLLSYFTFINLVSAT